MRNMLLKLEKKFGSLHPRDQKIFPYFVFACIFLIFYFLLISPLSIKTTRLSLDNRQMDQEAFSLKQKLQIMDTVKKRAVEERKQSEVYKKEFADMKRHVPSKDDISKIVAHLADSEKVSFLIQNIAEQDYVENKRFTTIPVAIAVQADYNNVYQFLKSMESSERLLTIDGLQIGVNPKDPVNVSARFTVNAYKIRDLSVLVKLYQQEMLEKKNNEKKK